MRLLAFGPAVALALFAAIAGIVIALYLLRPPPRRITVASLLVWSRVLERRPRDSKRWRWWLSLALSLLAALALAFALARPEVASVGGAMRHAVIVIDTSPTMATVGTDGRSRFDHAVDAARGLVADAGPASRFLIADTMHTVGSPGFDDRRDVLKTLATLKPAAGGMPRFPGIGSGAGGAADLPSSIVFISDGVAPLSLPAGVRTISVFEPAPNVGITAFDVRPQATDPRRFDAFVEVGNAGAAPVDVRVVVSGPGHAPVESRVSVGARGFGTVNLPASDFTGGALSARVEAAGDALAADDTAFAFMPVNKLVRVGLVTTGNAPLEHALRLDPRVLLKVIAPRQYAARTGIDVYVFDRFTPAQAPIAPALLIRPEAAAWLPAIAGTIAVPAIDAWLVDHPVLDDIALRDIQIERAVAFKPVPGKALVLARTAAGAALVTASETLPRWVAVGFALADTNFAYQASFPMFLSNAIAWLSGEPPAIGRPLGTVTVPIENARVTRIDGGRVDTRFVPGATLFSAERAGFFTAEGAAGRLRVLANVADPAVTDVNASTLAPATAPAAAPAASASASVAWEPWFVLLLASLLLMSVEWLAYHRRVTE